MSNARVGTLLVAVLSLCAAPAAAQICAGYPTVDDQFSFGGHFGFPEAGEQWGLDGSFNFPGMVSLFAGFQMASFDDDDDWFDTYHGGIALDPLIPSVGLGGASRLSICPVAEVRYGDTDNGSLWEFPLGLGFGANFPVASGVGLAPYVIPQLVIHHFDGDDDLGVDSESDAQFGIKGGLLANFGIGGFGSVFVGGELSHVFTEIDTDPVFALRAGVAFGAP